MLTKVCFKCHQELPLDGFYRHPQMADGHLNKCKECAKKDVHENRGDKIEKYRAYDRARGNRQSAEYISDYRRRYPNKWCSVKMVNNAIRDGKLFSEPCAVCGEEKTHAHHDDYSKPLNVRWLCAAHHKQWHLENGEGKNGGFTGETTSAE
jgi:hypothetical protein